MGCGASVKAASVEQKQAIFQSAAREMMILTVPKAMECCEELKVPAPGQVHSLRHTVVGLRKKAAELTDKGEDAPADANAEPPAEAPPAQEQKKGMVGGLMDKAQGLAEKAAAATEKVLDKVSDVSGGVTAAVLKAMADRLEKVLDKVEGEFADTGKLIIKEKKEEMMDIYALIINRIEIPDAVTLIRGAEPWDQETYDACTPDALSAWITETGKLALREQLLPVSQPCIDKFTIAKTWDSTIEQYNAVMEEMKKHEFLADMTKQNEIKLDINEWIVDQTILGLGVLMGKEEEKMRKEPSGKSRKPETFALCFSGAVPYSKLTGDHFKNKDQ